MARPRRKSSTGVAVALSALVHVALLASLARVIPLPSPLPDHDIAIEFAPLAAEAPSAVRTPRPPAPARRRTASAPQRKAQTVPEKAPVNTKLKPIVPAPPLIPARAAARAAASQAPGVPASAPQQASRGQSAGAGTPSPAGKPQDGVQSALRTTVGCSHVDYLALTPAERDACARGFGRQAMIGGRQWVDPLSSAASRVEYERERESCDRLHHYATPMDEDKDHSAAPPGKWGVASLAC